MLPLPHRSSPPCNTPGDRWGRNAPSDPKRTFFCVSVRIRRSQENICVCRYISDRVEAIRQIICVCVYVYVHKYIRAQNMYGYVDMFRILRIRVCIKVGTG